MTIPGITEAEELVSFRAEADHRNWDVLIHLSPVATELMRLNQEGRPIELVAFLTDGVTYALDNAYVTSVSFSGSEPELVSVGFAADEVRFI